LTHRKRKNLSPKIYIRFMKNFLPLTSLLYKIYEEKTLAEKEKTSLLYKIYEEFFTFKINWLHPPGTLKPSKYHSCWSKNAFFEGFGVPGGCKSILHVKILHKFYIKNLFEPRFFFLFFRESKKIFVELFADFCSNLKKFKNVIFPLLLPPLTVFFFEFFNYKPFTFLWIVMFSRIKM